MTWTVETLNATVDKEIEALPAEMGNADEGGTDGISRALYVTARNKRVVIVRVFIKKTEKTPRREIEIAITRANEVQDDQN